MSIGQPVGRWPDGNWLGGGSGKDRREAGLSVGEPPSPRYLWGMSDGAQLFFLAVICPAALAAALAVPVLLMLVVVPLIFIGGYLLSVKLFK